MQTELKLALGPIPYYWPKPRVQAFYKDIAKAPVEIVYLGETVCPKRTEMRLEDWLELAAQLTAAGKEVVLSTLTLLEAESELQRLRRICDNDEYQVEANDIGAMQMLQGRPFVAGPSVNIYNERSLQRLAKLGLRRWVLPVELSHHTLADMQAHRPAGVATEVFAYGRLPLSYSARCFTARAHDLPKDDCRGCCIEHPDGLTIATQEATEFLTLNGVQVLSACVCNLIAELPTIRDLAVDVLRLSPQAEHTLDVIDMFDQCRRDALDPATGFARLEPMMPGPTCNGYWHGEAGMRHFAVATA